MRFVLAAATLLSADPALAEWRTMTGDEIAAALTDRRLVDDGALQDFDALGRTQYNAVRDTFGRCRVEGTGGDDSIRRYGN